MSSLELSPKLYRSISYIVRAGFATARPRPPRSRLTPNTRQPERRWAPRPGKPLREEQPRKETLSQALRDTKAKDNTLLSPVHIPEDPNGILNEKHPATSILANSAIVVQRQLELMNVLIGFEQANKYVILDPQGNHIGFIAEQDNSLGRSMARQMFNTHRSFTTHVFDKNEREILRVCQILHLSHVVASLAEHIPVS